MQSLLYKESFNSTTTASPLAISNGNEFPPKVMMKTQTPAVNQFQSWFPELLKTS